MLPGKIFIGKNLVILSRHCKATWEHLTFLWHIPTKTHINNSPEHHFQLLRAAEPQKAWPQSTHPKRWALGQQYFGVCFAKFSHSATLNIATHRHFKTLIESSRCKQLPFLGWSWIAFLIQSCQRNLIPIQSNRRSKLGNSNGYMYYIMGGMVLTSHVEI